MKLSKAAKIWIDYHKIHSKKNTMRAYRIVIERFIREYGDGPVEQVTLEQIFTFLNRLTDGNNPTPSGSVTSSSLLFSISCVTISIRNSGIHTAGP